MILIIIEFNTNHNTELYGTFLYLTGIIIISQILSSNLYLKSKHGLEKKKRTHIKGYLSCILNFI